MPLTLLTVCLWPIQAPIKPNRTSLTPLSGENRVGNRSRYIGSLRSSGFTRPWPNGIAAVICFRPCSRVLAFSLRFRTDIDVRCSAS